MNAKYNRVRPVAPVPPHASQGGLVGFFQLVVSLLIWLVMMVVFAIGAYSVWFTSSLAHLFHRPIKIIPWWFALGCTLLIFPVTLIVIAVSAIVKILQHPKK